MRRITIEGSRISLVLLGRQDLQLWKEDKSKEEKRLGLKIDAGPLEPALLHAFDKKIDNMEKNPKSELWYSYYGILLKDTIIGTIGPKGRLDDGKTIEIGYGVSEDYRSRGYASEAVGIFCEWYFRRTEIERIKAVTNVDNYPSHKVLKNNGFKVSKELEDRIEWETSRPLAGVKP